MQAFVVASTRNPSSVFRKRFLSTTSRGALGRSMPPLNSPLRHRPVASLATDRRAEKDTVPPDGNATPPCDGAGERMFSNIEPDGNGNLRRVPASELGCAALVAGTMIGAGVLALPTVAAPAGFVPSSLALMGVWAYMSATGLLISEVSINTACSLGRPSGVSLLSLGELTLGRPGAVLTAASYTILHYAILTAYTSQGGVMLSELTHMAEDAAHITASTLALPNTAGALLFAGAIGGGMYVLSSSTVEKINNALVAAALAAFAAVVGVAGAHVDIPRLMSGSHWDRLIHGELVPVLFVSCVYHNIVSTISMRLEGDRKKIRRVIVGGSAVPLTMFLVYDAAILGGSSAGSAVGQNALAIACFSLLAIATSFIGFVEGLTELWSDVRISALQQTPQRAAELRYQDFLLTLLPPVAFAFLSPDIFLKALDAAGTYGIAVLFGALPAAMAWKNRAGAGKGFRRMVAGGKGVLGGVALVPVLLIGSRVWEGLLHRGL